MSTFNLQLGSGRSSSSGLWWSLAAKERARGPTLKQKRVPDPQHKLLQGSLLKGVSHFRDTERLERTA